MPIALPAYPEAHVCFIWESCVGFGRFMSGCWPCRMVSFCLPLCYSEFCIGVGRIRVAIFGVASPASYLTLMRMLVVCLFCFFSFGVAMISVGTL
jgi:hypothetical protein